MRVGDLLYTLPFSQNVLIFRHQPEGGGIYVGPTFVLGLHLAGGQASALVHAKEVLPEPDLLRIF